VSGNYQSRRAKYVIAGNNAVVGRRIKAAITNSGGSCGAGGVGEARTAGGEVSKRGVKEGGAVWSSSEPVEARATRTGLFLKLETSGSAGAFKAGGKRQKREQWSKRRRRAGVEEHGRVCLAVGNGSTITVRESDGRRLSEVGRGAEEIA